jgi:hypothetical protein
MKSSVLHISAVCHASPMHVSDEQLESLWSKLVNKDGTRAPSDVVLAFASLGGSDAEAVYCTSWAEQQRSSGWSWLWMVTFWFTCRPMVGAFGVEMRTGRRSHWRLRRSSSLLCVCRRDRGTDVRGGDWGGAYGFGELRRPIAPWHPLWVLTKDWNSAAGAHQQCHLTCSFLDSRAHHTPPPSRAVTSAG